MIHTIKNIVKKIPGAEELHYLISNLNNRLDFEKVPLLPSAVMIELNNTCNLHCQMCGTKSARRKRGVMAIDDYRQIINEVARLGIRNITLYTHGEPLLYPHLAEAVRIAKEKGLIVSISTNGNLLNEKLGRELLTAGLDVLRYSIEGASQSSYENIRIGGNFEQLLANMEHFKKMRDQAGAKTAIHLNTIVMTDTEPELEEFISLYSPLVDSMHFSLLSNQAGSYKFFERSSVKSASTKRKYPCSLFWKTFIVNWDLTVSSCCIDFHGELIGGNLRDNSIEEIWHGKKLQHFRDLHRKGLFGEMPLCGGCNSNTVSKYDEFHFDRVIHRKYKKYFRFSPPPKLKKRTTSTTEQDGAVDACLDKST